MRYALLVALLCATIARSASAADIGKNISISGVAAGAGQCLVPSQKTGGECGGAIPFQPRASIWQGDTSELHAKLGFAHGNGLNSLSPFLLSTWAADLEADVVDINGRDRDFLLTAWYKHTLPLGGQQTLAFTAGIIDSEDYLDGNAYANDEYNQFMNAAFVNSVTAFLPSYDYGAAAELVVGNWSISAVLMDVGENGNGESYTFFGAQLAHTIDWYPGKGTYRIVVTGTNKAFLNPGQNDRENLFGITFNADQQISNGVGAFVRIGWQNDSAAVDYDLMLSGGLDFSGEIWGRPGDNIGVAAANLSGGNGDVSASNVVEAYYRFALGNYAAITADIQYLRDDYLQGSVSQGFVFGLRGTVEF